MRDWIELARLRDGRDFLFSNGGWNRDAYPDLQPLNAGTSITVASFEGPAVATHFHCVNRTVFDGTGSGPLDSAQTRRGHCSRGIVLEVYYDGSTQPSVRVPLSDFFADGCMGKAELPAPCA